jgi:hypothetical protein
MKSKILLIHIILSVILFSCRTEKPASTYWKMKKRTKADYPFN